jgi:hypothetical protein
MRAGLQQLLPLCQHTCGTADSQLVCEQLCRFALLRTQTGSLHNPNSSSHNKHVWKVVKGPLW